MDKVTKRKREKEGVEQAGGHGPVDREGGLYLDISAEVSRVPSYATADGAGLPT